jgi:hypothetical protein
VFQLPLPPQFGQGAKIARDAVAVAQDGGMHIEQSAVSIEHDGSRFHQPVPFSGERADSDANIQLSTQSVHHDAAAVRNFHQLFKKLRVRAVGGDVQFQG